MRTEKKVIDFRGKVVPLVFVRDIFQVTDAPLEEDFYSLVIIQKGEKLPASWSTLSLDSTTLF